MFQAFTTCHSGFGNDLFRAQRRRIARQARSRSVFWHARGREMISRASGSQVLGKCGARPTSRARDPVMRIRRAEKTRSNPSGVDRTAFNL
ncbi:MAG: hypothetical protein U1F35_21310 [Steroidobacteraceae bacterium]